MLEFKTSLGRFTVELHAEDAPLSCENFLEYVDAGFYDGLVFHRVIPDFMVQGGGMSPDMQQKKGRGSIKNEAKNGLRNRRGTLAMARTDDIDSATSQFFVNLKDNAFLDHRPGSYGYAVFARVVDGMDVVDAIAAVKTGRRGHHDDVPLEPVVIESVKRIEG